MTTLPPTDRPADRAATLSPLTCADPSSSTTTVEPALPALPSAGRQSQLSDRDVAVLRSLGLLRLLTAGQVQRLHVADGSPRTQARRTRSLLERLAKLRLVVRFNRQVGGVRAGSSGFVYGLSARGQAVVGIGGVHGGRRRRVWDTKLGFQNHVLAVAELYVTLIEAERHGQTEVLEFQAEPGCWRRTSGSGGEPVILKPDAYLRLGVGEEERSAFVEVDLATESGPTVARKCQAYVAYWRSGAEQAQRDVFPAVVWLTTTEQRAARIADAIQRLPIEARALFQIALLAQGVNVLSGANGGTA